MQLLATAVPLLQAQALPLGVGAAGLLGIGLMAWRSRRQRRRLAALRDQLAELEELAAKDRASLAHCRERLVERKEAQAPALNQLRALRKLVNVAELGEDGRLLGANRRLLRLLGSEAGPPPPWPPGWQAAWQQAQPRLAEGKSWQGRVLIGEAGSSLWLHIGPLPQAEGEAPRWLAVGNELGLLERRHRELLDSLERHGELLDGLRAGGWAWELEADRLRLDRRLLALLGLPAAGAVQTAGASFLHERLHAADEPAWREALHAHLQGQSEGLNLRLRLRHADGSWLPLLLRAAIVQRSAGGEPRRLAGVLLPVAEVPVATAAPAAYDELLAQAQLGLGQAGLLWTPQPDRLQWQGAATELLQRAELPAQPLEQALLAVQADDRERLREALQAAAAGRPWRGELRLLGALGVERRVLLSLAGRADAVLGLLQALPEAPRRLQPQAQRVPLALALRSANQGLKLPRALERFAGDAALLQRTARDFAASSRSLPAQLRAAREPAALREAASALHGFQGVALTLGCEELAQWARGGLQHLRAGQVLEPVWLDEFTRRRQAAIDALLAACNELRAPRLSDEAPSLPDLEALRRLVAANDPQAQAWLQAQRAQLAPWLGERVARLEAALQAQDFEAARALLAA